MKKIIGVSHLLIAAAVGAGFVIELDNYWYALDCVVIVFCVAAGLFLIIRK